MSMRNKMRLCLGGIFLLSSALFWFVTQSLFLITVLLHLLLYFVLLAYLERKLFCRFEEIKDKIKNIQGNFSLSRENLGEYDELETIVLGLKQVEEQMRAYQQQVLMMENLTDLITFFDTDWRVYYVSQSYKKLLGYELQEVMALKVSGIFHSEDMDKVWSSLERVRRTHQQDKIEVRMRHSDGHYLWFESLHIPLCNALGDLKGFLVSSRDITRRKEMEEKLRQLGFHDSLTGIYNRMYFEQEMNRLEENRTGSIGIIIGDLDDLKLYNDGIGHAAGDELLKAVANILKSCFREEDIVARIGGDEFAVILPNSGLPVVKNAIKRIRNAIDNYNRGNPKLPISLSLGYAVGGIESTLRDLFKEADNNMYSEKLRHSISDYSSTISILMRTLEARDYRPMGDSDILQSMVLDFAKYLQLSEQQQEKLRLFVRYHDIGVVGVPDRILFKKGKLSAAEKKEMEHHCEIGYRIALSAVDLVPVADWILKHHEWWNGQGYPRQLKAEEIPLECRILAIAEAYHAMTSFRPYRQVFSHREAVNELRKNAGVQFDPELTEAFITMLEQKQIHVS